MLILGGGGGREALWFARQGWQVAAVDFSARMLQQTRERMAERQFASSGWVGDIARLDAPPGSFDLVWVSMFLYSTVLNRARRIAMLRRIHDALAPGGVLVVSFHWQPEARSGRTGVMVRKLIAWLTLGNLGYENGDLLFGTLEFRHAFHREQDLCAEFDAGGFEILHGGPIVFHGMGRGGAILRKRET